MKRILAEVAVSISELKKSSTRVMADAAGLPVAVLDRNCVVTYLVPAELYEQMLERLDDFELADWQKRVRLNNPSRWLWKTYKQEQIFWHCLDINPTLCQPAPSWKGLPHRCYLIQITEG